MNKLPISAIVASCNEGHLLEDCLKSLQFCEEIYFVNLDSTDNSYEIALKYATSLSHYNKVDTIEEIFPVYIPKLKNNWFLLIDPDEVIDIELKNDIIAFFNEVPVDCGRINVPIRYYFKRKALKGTIWGGKRHGRLLFNRSACEISDKVHIAINLKNGYKKYSIPYKDKNVDHHYWATSFKQLYEKHKRYSENEGPAKYINGERFSLSKLFMESISAFNTSFFKLKGYLDGILGLKLSLFYSWYIWSSIISLRDYQKKQKKWA
jgi:hypothetical protein